MLVALAAVVAAAVALSARGPDPRSRPTAEAVEARVMSSWCPGLTLAECPSAQAGELRSRIASRVAEGWTNRRIDEWLVSNYGERVLGSPRNPAAFLVPAAAILMGGLAVAFVLRRRGGPAGAGEAPLPPPGKPEPPSEAADPYRSRLDAELRRFAGEATE